jgi:hypothetical protein
MDPLTLILTALVTGATASLKDTAGDAIKDAYNGLKTLIQRKFMGKPTAEMALTEHEKKPDVWKAPLEEGLKETGTDQDQEVIAAAQKLMTLVQPQQAAMGKYNVQITGDVQGFAQGDNQQVTMNFENESREK